MQNFYPDDNYDDYLHTVHWEETRQSAIARAGNVCENCGISGKRYILNCHHLTYQNKWDEQPDDLIVLCKTCHENVHKCGIEVHRNFNGGNKSADHLGFLLVIGLLIFLTFLFGGNHTEFLYLLIIAIVIVSIIFILKRKKYTISNINNKIESETVPPIENDFEPEEPNPYFYRDPETGYYIVTRWGDNLICKSRKAAELLSSDLTNEEVNRKLAELEEKENQNCR